MGNQLWNSLRVRKAKVIGKNSTTISYDRPLTTRSILKCKNVVAVVTIDGGIVAVTETLS